MITISDVNMVNSKIIHEILSTFMDVKLPNEIAFAIDIEMIPRRIERTVITPTMRWNARKTGELVANNFLRLVFDLTIRKIRKAKLGINKRTSQAERIKFKICKF